MKLQIDELLSEPITRDDLRIFPPHLGHFALATGCMMVSHGLSTSWAFSALLPSHLGLAFGLSLATSLIFGVFNFMLIRGHLRSLKYLERLAIIYSVVSVASLSDAGQLSANLWMSVVMIISSGISWWTIRSPQYRIMAAFIAKRWRFYRETGRTIIEEIQRQDLEAMGRVRKQRKITRKNHRK